MKFRLNVELGMEHRSEEVDIPYEEIEGLTDEQIMQHVENEYLSDYVSNRVGSYAERIDE